MQCSYSAELVVIRDVLKMAVEVMVSTQMWNVVVRSEGRASFCGEKIKKRKEK